MTFLTHEAIPEIPTFLSGESKSPTKIRPTWKIAAQILISNLAEIIIDFYYSLCIHLGANMTVKDAIIEADYHEMLDIHDEKVHISSELILFFSNHVCLFWLYSARKTITRGKWFLSSVMITCLITHFTHFILTTLFGHHQTITCSQVIFRVTGYHTSPKVWEPPPQKKILRGDTTHKAKTEFGEPLETKQSDLDGFKTEWILWFFQSKATSAHLGWDAQPC